MEKNDSSELIRRLKGSKEFLEILRTKLKRIWQGLSKEARESILEGNALEINFPEEGEEKPDKKESGLLLRLEHEFWIFASSKSLPNMMKLRGALLHPKAQGLQEMRLAVNSIAIGLVNSIKENTHSDPKTFSYFYHSVQRMLKYHFGTRLHKDGRWFCPEGFTEQDVEDYCSDAEHYAKEGFKQIPLPPNPPFKKEFFAGSDLCAAQFKELIVYYRDEAEKLGLGPSVQIRSFCYWLNGHYSFVSGEATSLDQTCLDEDDDDRTLGDTIDSCEGLTQSEEYEQVEDCIAATEMAEIAKKIYEQMSTENKEICRLWKEGYTDKEIAEKLGLEKPRQAETRRNRFVKEVFHPLKEKFTEFSMEGGKNLMFLVIDRLFELCQNEKNQLLPTRKRLL